MTQVAESLDRYLAELEGADAARDAEAPSWLTRARRRARDRFQALGWPTTADEDWRFTSVAPIVETRFALAVDGRTALGRADLTPFRLPEIARSELVFVNGRFVPDLSNIEALPRGVRVQNLASTLRADPEEVERHLTRVAPFERHAFTALNTALFADGAFLYIPPGDIIESPIHVLFVSTDEGRPTMAHPRVLAVVGENAQVSIVETYAGLRSRYFTNAITEVVVGENASVDHYKIQRESLHAYHVATMQVVQKRNSRFHSHSLSFGGALVRNDVYAALDGEGVECTLNGLYLADDRRVVDNHTTIDHAKPHCDSREIYKGILADHARAIFNGKIIVRPDAQKTDAKQTNKALLLSEDAQINTKPQLEIFANDVKCTHGAAVGQMDEEAIFYLRARGLDVDEAKNLLIHAFAGDVLNRMPLEALRSRADALLLEQLPATRIR
jgi:Fe-S cluster assembly protein SufD